jgi:hypothetical protein
MAAAGFLEHAPHRLAADRDDEPAGHHLLGQQRHRPTPPPRRRLCTAQRDQTRLGQAVHLRRHRRAWALPAVDRPFAAHGERLPHAGDGVDVQAQGRPICRSV